MHCSKVIVTLHQTGRREESAFVLLCEVPRLPEVTIKTHLSAQANVFIPDSTAVGGEGKKKASLANLWFHSHH